MMVISIAVVWLVMGFGVAMLFGAAFQRTNRQSEEEVSEQRTAEIQYLRKDKLADSLIARGAAIAAPKKQHIKRHIAAA
jgi:hypothetical protein